jgi:hypothetical protein
MFLKEVVKHEILCRLRKKTPILLNRMSKNGHGFLSEPTLNEPGHYRDRVLTVLRK